MDKKEVIQKEKEKLNKIFGKVDDNTKQLTEKLINQAANLAGELEEIYEIIEKSKSIAIHPQNLNKQKINESAKLYNKYLNTYAVVIKTLYSMLAKTDMEEDDDLTFLERKINPCG